MTPKLLAAQFSEIFVASRGICQSVGVSSRKGEHCPLWAKEGAHKNKACYRIARKVNPVMRRHFNARRRARRGSVTNFGFVVMDYPDYSLIRELVSSNFK